MKNRFSPLTSATDAIREALGEDLPFLRSRDKLAFEVSEHSSQEEPAFFDGIVSWTAKTKELSVHIIAKDIFFYPFRGSSLFLAILDGHLQSFLKGRYDGPGKLKALREGDGGIVPAFGGGFLCKMDDESFVYELSYQTLIRALYGIRLVYPIFDYMMKHTTLPSDYDCLRIMYYQYGTSEVQGYTKDTPSNIVRLPQNFGGKELLWRQ